MSNLSCAHKPRFCGNIPYSLLNSCNSTKVHLSRSMMPSTLTEINTDLVEMTQDWVALGSVDLGDFVDENLDELPDWNRNLKMLKSVTRDAERLPLETKVDCYRISLAPLRAAVDDQIRKLEDALVVSLRRKVRFIVATLTSSNVLHHEWLEDKPWVTSCSWSLFIERDYTKVWLHNS